ncbi:peptidoglycan D,D-transpeptidase FtsI family protein [Sinosporangium siamense]|uniref:Penicillin-binding protein A n=1 Tax=Sinosporangium siamense TaxID=1367973 RepID=A0A919RHZ3_9ACTN|nr:penicillin-binding transpeptidase domain-containing protein [Sinosporangium siamense]GII92729.1 penicillin-binding protein A [Sinosporangium siamense]
MIGARTERMNIPLRHTAVACGVMLFALLGRVTIIQAFQADGLRADDRNSRTLIARFEHPRGRLLLRDGTVIADSRKVTAGVYRYRRVYADGPMFAAVTGHLSLFSRSGVEKSEDAVLAGTDPKVKVRALMRDGVPSGATLKLTLDGSAQRAAYDALRATGRPGAVVALNPATGAVLAMASVPSYDPGIYTSFDVPALTSADRRLQTDRARPLLNRALRRTYPPGSTFKIVTAAAALESGDYSPRRDVRAPVALRLPGTRISVRNAKGAACGDGRPSLAYAFRASCNTAFAAIGLELGQEAVREQARRFGFDSDDLVVPMPVAVSAYPTRMDRAQTAMAAIGQYDVRATPLLIAMMSAAVANGGVLMRPYLVEETRLPDGTVIDSAQPTRYRDTMSARTAASLTAMMTAVTRNGGTGTAAAIPGVTVAAKTGTAENHAGRRSHAVVTAFAPAKDPRVAVGVLVEGGGYGGRTAAPIARAVMRAVLSL